jgi:outer membrane protein
MSITAPGRLKSVTVAALACLTLAVPAGAETLADTLILAYRNSNLLDQNRAVLRAADEDAASALASLRPVISYVLQSGYAKTGGGEGLASSLTLNANYTLYDFGRGKLGTEIAKETILATREALIGVEQNVLLDAVQAYMDVKSASESVAINDNSASVIGEALDAAQARFEVGDITRTEVAQAEARLASARAALASAQGGLAVARENYKAATGVYPGRLAAAPKAPALPKSLDEAKAIAQRTHPSVRQAQREVTVAELGVASAAADRLPILSLGASATNDGDETTGRAGLELSQTLYAGGARSSAHRKAIARRDQARSALLLSGVGISQQVGIAWSNIAVTRAQIDAIDRQIRAATVAYRGISEEANLGARTTLDVLDAEQELLDAQASRISAEANLQVAIYSLLASMGLLTVDHLNLGIPTYDPAAYYNAVRKAPWTSVQGKSLDRVLKAIGQD